MLDLNFLVKYWIANPLILIISNAKLVDSNSFSDMYYTDDISYFKAKKHRSIFSFSSSEANLMEQPFI